MSELQLSLGDLNYKWIDGWAQIPESDGWAHHDIVLTEDERIITGHPTVTDVLFFNPDGVLLNSWAAPVIEAHGFCLAKENGREILWIADIGRKRHPGQNYEYPHNYDGKILKCSLDGEVLAQTDNPFVVGDFGRRFDRPQRKGERGK